jgi:protein translocase SecG subunit
MSWIVGILSFFLILACLLLMLLVLIQLPKKEAGMGQAFGGGATDALFGAGSGTALTKMTKYTTGIFFVLTLLLWVLKTQEVRHQGSTLERTMQQLGKTERPTPKAAAPDQKTAPANSLLTSQTNTSLLLSATNAAPAVTATNNSPKGSTNAPPKAEAEKAK